MNKFLKKLHNRLFKTYSVILFFIVWELTARFTTVINPTFFPPISTILVALWNLIISGELERNLWISLQRALIGYAVGVAVAVPLGLCLGWFRRAGDFLNPLFNALRNTPTIALMPLFIMFFGISETSKVIIIFWGVIWGVLVNTISGVYSVDPQLVRASRTMGTSGVRLFVTVVFPGSLPYIFTGMRISATASILVLISAEMLGASIGLGRRLFHYQSYMKYPQMYAYILVMAALGVGLNSLLEWVEGHSFRWRDETGLT